MRANQILIVDEVLAVGFRLGERYSSERDAEFHKKCLGKMKNVAGRADSQRLTIIVPIA
jgi:ABC-type polysaccharide/polyol phosphate transport system ATPase subunit